MIREEFDFREWGGPFDAATRARAQAALEHGRLLYFPRMPFKLTNSETEFLDGRLTDGKAKNISLDHTNGKLQGTSARGEQAQRLAAMIERFGAGATRFVKELLPNYGSVERARTSYRPVEVEGRAYSVISDDRLLHVDAFPSRPMKDGRRILRFFANVAPHSANGGGARHWEVGEPFADFATHFVQAKVHLILSIAEQAETGDLVRHPVYLSWGVGMGESDEQAEPAVDRSSNATLDRDRCASNALQDDAHLGSPL